MRAKNINYIYNDSSESELLAQILQQSPAAIYREVHTMLQKFDEDTALEATFNVNTLIEFINDNVQNNMFSLNTVATRFNLNTTYCSTLLKNTLGTNFHEYITTLRVNRAKELLKNTNKSIQEIYSETGFTNRQTFIRSFKKYNNVTPTEFRNEIHQ